MLDFCTIVDGQNGSLETVNNCEGQSGGLAIFWKKEVNFHLHAVSRLYLDGDVVEADGFVWRFTGFYGEPRTDKKELSWKALRVLNAARKNPWLCMGDFNEILMGCEEGGVCRGHRSAWTGSGRRWRIVRWRT